MVHLNQAVLVWLQEGLKQRARQLNRRPRQLPFGDLVSNSMTPA